MAYWPERVPAWPRVRQQRSERLQDVFLGLIETAPARLLLSLLLTIALAGVIGLVAQPPRQLTRNAAGQRLPEVARQNDLRVLLGGMSFRNVQREPLLRQGAEVSGQRAVPVIVNADGRAMTWRTRAETVRGLLNELQLDVSPYDIVRLNGADVALNDSVVQAPASGETLVTLPGVATLEIRRAVPLTIYEDGRAVTFRSARTTVELALQEAGVRLGPADIVDPPAHAPLVAGMAVTVRHAKAVTLLIGNEEHTIYTQRPQLREALADIGLRLGAEDRVEPGLDTAVADGLRARLVRVAGREFIERETVARKTEFRPDPNLTGSSYRVVQGHDGTRARTYRVVIENGVEKEKRLVRDVWERPMAPTVIYYPAGSAQPTGLPDGNINVTGVHRVFATWYNATSSGKQPGDPAYAITKTGVPLRKGIVAVDPTFIPLGTRLYIPGYGFAVAADTGGGIKGNMIDLGYPDGVPSDWRTGWVDIYVLGE